MSGEADKNNSFDEQNKNYQTISQSFTCSFNTMLELPL
ncbi:hypothetical protein T4B_8449 [Trichinella pseudospiralis]|uniref:Uncharacterized protein n=1 Tax=Trichinella pseudospiralis TaxID=6337 RepID=A0A0V1GIZ1_TRIPS|nr:hypothetical protein T4B_8449 [Trichinella pseudospiralis]